MNRRTFVGIVAAGATTSAALLPTMVPGTMALGSMGAGDRQAAPRLGDGQWQAKTRPSSL
jgi:hypothetical protein